MTLEERSRLKERSIAIPADPLRLVFPPWLPALREAGYDIGKVSENHRRSVRDGLARGRVHLPDGRPWPA